MTAHFLDLEEGMTVLYRSAQGPSEYVGNVFRVRAVNELTLDGGYPLRVFRGRCEPSIDRLTREFFPLTDGTRFQLYKGEEDVRKYLLREGFDNGRITSLLTELDQLNGQKS